MKLSALFSPVLILIGCSLIAACGGGGGGGGGDKPSLIQVTNQFQQNLSTYNIYHGNPEDLTPTADYHLFKLGSSLYVNQAEKQRLIKLPAGTQMTKNGNGLPNFPDGTILVKTFYYYVDERDPALGKQLIETRLLEKQAGVWNAATYVWECCSD